MDRNSLHSLTSLREDKVSFTHILIGLLLFVLVVILMETHNYCTGKYDLLERDDERDDEKDYSKDKDVKQNINVIRRKNTVIIKD